MKSRASFSSVDHCLPLKVAKQAIHSLWLVMTLLSLIAGHVYADPAVKPENPEEAYNQLAQKLNLSEEQKPKVQAIFKENLESLKKIRTADDNRLGKAKALRENRKETDKKLSTVLNDQQMQTYKELRKEMRDKLKAQRDQQKTSE